MTDFTEYYLPEKRKWGQKFVDTIRLLKVKNINHIV